MPGPRKTRAAQCALRDVVRQRRAHRDAACRLVLQNNYVIEAISDLQRVDHDDREVTSLVNEWTGQLWNPDFAKMAEPMGGRGIGTHEVASHSRARRHDLPRDSLAAAGAFAASGRNCRASRQTPQTARVDERIIDALKDVRVVGAHPAGAALSRS